MAGGRGKGCLLWLAVGPGFDGRELRDRLVVSLSGTIDGEMCVCELSEVVGLSVSATSHQLHQLRELRLVGSRADGKLVHYSLHDPYVLALLDDCARHVSGQEARA
jgi:DNA-binding transcriptional ArsR family regulator